MEQQLEVEIRPWIIIVIAIMALLIARIPNGNEEQVCIDETVNDGKDAKREEKLFNNINIIVTINNNSNNNSNNSPWPL
ncbi:hypothetical protein BCR41DRAFT_396870 [Lobosporangium transversale]|uniref:Uncharacterized protein n=1 Tax=Lobosporangium transversale TaxID=64571 RepID=A0A1Y2GLE3_9FUNG|nr:hypothetical protein BCR41DRAFT_396870 [Lobosporangium transversale]ORZ14389.1 hypothetical protein BCR41DRAFT_396870 [Lobosporangium transversale]|eukprot:XP_021880867.1 hypothetical protein BCR41DRAFT_396870 [Lobosporangium transversale]